MKPCNHSHWLSLYTQGNETTLLETDTLQTLTNHIRYPDMQQPSLFVLIGNTAKSLALRELFGVKKTRKFKGKRNTGEIHLHLDPSSIFYNRPILFADGDLPKEDLRKNLAVAEKCHVTTRRSLSKVRMGLSLNEIADSIYTRLLFLFADVLCFFSSDLGGFKQIACHMAAWLEKGQSSTLPKSTYPRVVIVTEKIPLGAESEKEARNAFIRMLREETTKDLSEQVSAINVVALFPNGKMSDEARHRCLKERLMDESDQVRKNKGDTRTLFSATHFAAFFKYACDHLSETFEEPLDFIKLSRIQNPIAADLQEHLSNFLKHIKSPMELIEFAVPMIASSFLLDSYPPDIHMFEPTSVFKTLYKGVFTQVSKDRVMAFEGSEDVILRSGFINMVENHLLDLFERSIQDTMTSSDIHRDNLRRFEGRWHSIQSSSICLVCLRRRPQYGLQCGHCICENCVVIFRECCEDDPWVFKVQHCFLCGAEMPEEVIVRVHPPTAGVGVLCIDGGGARGVVPLKLMKRIQDRIGLPIPFQTLFKVAFGISSGLIVLAMFMNGWSIDESTETFEKLAKLAFKRRRVLDIPLLSRVQEFVVSYLFDGIYPAKNIEAALKEVFGVDKSILDCSHATSIGTRVGVPVATIREPSCCIFTNYNGVGIRDQDQELDPHPQRLVFFHQNIYLELAHFKMLVLSKTIHLSRLFQRHWCPADGAFPRLCRMYWEKIRDRKVRQIFQTHPRYHRLDIEFDGPEPRLDDTDSMPELKSKAGTDRSLSKVIDNIARCVIASLFYFELDSVPERSNGEYIGTGCILCSLRYNNPAFRVLLDRLSSNNARFYLNDCLISGIVGDYSSFGRDGNFRKRLELKATNKFMISLKQDESEPCNISGSPFSIDRLVLAQGLNASFGRANHRKRKRLSDSDVPARKKQRI
ncbi:MAG: hypothetical protein M1839_004369 [Geoglossum umbratile]|nr:MAG: hypothetical protein M1839_004369 [Geoglossum umbratile]